MKPCQKILLCFVAALVACTPIEAQRGQIVSDEELSRLIVGTTAKPEILAAIGTPTAVGTLDDSQWYYIGENTKEIGIHPTSVTDRRVVALRFDSNGILESKRVMEKNDGQRIPMAEGVTGVIGKEPTVLQQLIGNVGRFSKGGEKP